jgi:hypothetical protein
MRHSALALVSLLLVLSLAGCRSRSRVYGALVVCPPRCAPTVTVAPSPAQGLVGTTWVGTAWHGSYFRIEFRPDGRLTWTTKGPRMADGTWEDGIWRLEAERIVLEVSDGYATYTGTREGSRIHGSIRNIQGDQGTWDVRREE